MYNTMYIICLCLSEYPLASPKVPGGGHARVRDDADDDNDNDNDNDNNNNNNSNE